MFAIARLNTFDQERLAVFGHRRRVGKRGKLIAERDDLRMRAQQCGVAHARVTRRSGAGTYYSRGKGVVDK